MSQASEASHDMLKWVVWSSVTHGGCRFWKINPASIQPTPHISPSALQTSGHPPWVILLQLLMGSRSAVLSFYSESVRLEQRNKIYDGLKQKELKSPQGHGHTSKDTELILNEHEIIIVWNTVLCIAFIVSRVSGPYLLLIISHFYSTHGRISP